MGYQNEDTWYTLRSQAGFNDRRSLLYIVPSCLATSKGLMLFLFGMLVTQLVEEWSSG